MTRMRLAAITAVAAVLLTGGTASAAQLGVNVNGGAAGGTKESFEALSDTGARWARHFVFWDDIDDRGIRTYASIAAEEERRGVNTLFAVMSKEGAPPPNPQEYADFTGRLAQATGADAIQIWSQRDEPLVWDAAPSPQH